MLDAKARAPSRAYMLAAKLQWVAPGPSFSVANAEVMDQASFLLAPMSASRCAESGTGRQQGYMDSAPLGMQLSSLVQDTVAAFFSGDRP